MSSPRPIVLPERFELDREIGRGGMAVVYRAHDKHLERLVAIKVLSADLSDTVGVERFEREVALMAKLVHPGIVALFDSGVADGQLYYVMPFVSGETLRARLTRERRLAPPDSAALGADIAEALAYAHGLGIVHRDVKPENVFTVAGRAILADFGIARVVSGRTLGDGDVTTSGTVLGTVAYMSPEQASGDAKMDGRADLYSLGCMLYELLTGALPFDAPTLMGMLAKHASEVPRPPSERGVALSPELDALVCQLLAKKPADRPVNAGEVARALRAASHARAPHQTAAAVTSDGRHPGGTEAVTVGVIEYPDGDGECEPVAASVARAIASLLCTLPALRVTISQRSSPGGPSGAGGTGGPGLAAVPGTVVIGGSVRRSGQRLRVAMHVIGVDGAMRWSQQVDGTIDDIFALEDAVADRVLRHFVERTTNVSTIPGGRSIRTTGETSEADRLVAAGRKAFSRFAPSGGAAAVASLDEAKAYLTRALALDPRNARGLCAMGNLYYVSAVTGVLPREEALARGRELIFSALAADDQCAEVHCSMAKLALYYDDDFHAASRHVRRAAELDPADPEALRLLSIIYKIFGRSDDSVEAARAATDRARDSAPLWNALGDALLGAGRNAEAVDALKQAIGLLPAYGPALERLELARTRLGEFEMAVEIRASRMRLAGQRERAGQLDEEAVSVGAAEAIGRDVRRELDGLLLQAQRDDPFKDHVQRSMADRIVSGHAELGQWHEAMDWVERSYERRPGRLRRMLADLPVDYRGLAADPRYARLMRVAGLEEQM